MAKKKGKLQKKSYDSGLGAQSTKLQCPAANAINSINDISSKLDIDGNQKIEI